MLLTDCIVYRGQAYDGASNMSGIRKGVLALVKRETDRTLCTALRIA